MIPVGTTLAEGKFIRKGTAGSNGRKAEIRNAIHVGWNQQAMPVDRCFHAHIVMNTDTGDISFFKTQNRTGDPSVDGPVPGWFTCDVNLLLADCEIIFDACCLCMNMDEQN